jgi:hypothetical protein
MVIPSFAEKVRGRVPRPNESLGPAPIAGPGYRITGGDL